MKQNEYLSGHNAGWDLIGFRKKYFRKVTEMEEVGWKIWAANRVFFGNSGWKFNPEIPVLPQKYNMAVAAAAGPAEVQKLYNGTLDSFTHQ